MDLKELLPFLIVIAISIVGSLSKKKAKTEVTKGKPKGIFDTLLEELKTKMELDDNNDTSFEQEIIQMETLDEDVPNEVYTASPILEKEEEYKTTGYQSINALLKEKNKKKEPIKVMVSKNTKQKKKALSMNFKNPDEIKKAIIYGELFRPIHF